MGETHTCTIRHGVNHEERQIHIEKGNGIARVKQNQREKRGRKHRRRPKFQTERDAERTNG